MTWTALDEYTPAQASDRRRSPRFSRKFMTQMTAWSPGHAAVPLDVIISDISDTGVAVVHTEPIEIGLKYLLTVPRHNQRPVTLQYTVVRCEKRTDHTYTIGLQAERPHPLTPGSQVPAVVSRKTKVLFLLFGIIGLAVALLIPV